MCYFPIFAVLSIFLRAINADEAIKAKEDINTYYCSDNTCYMVSNEQTTSFEEAWWYCSASDSNLTSITSAEENKKAAIVCGCESCWIGLAERTEGDWWWLDGSTSNYRNWAEDEPNNYNGINEQFTIMNLDVPETMLFQMERSWYDVPMDFPYAVALCKVKKSTAITYGFRVRELPSEREKCENPYSWILELLFMLVITGCTCGCYGCYGCKVVSRDRAAHNVVLRKQDEFLRSRHMQQSYIPVPVAEPAPGYEHPNQGINPGSINQGSGQPNQEFANVPQPGAPQHYGAQVLPSEHLPPPSYMG